jgi:hypothetical protein
VTIASVSYDEGYFYVRGGSDNMVKKCYNCRHYIDGYCQAKDEPTDPYNSCVDHEEI